MTYPTPPAYYPPAPYSNPYTGVNGAGWNTDISTPWETGQAMGPAGYGTGMDGLFVGAPPAPGTPPGTPPNAPNGSLEPPEVAASMTLATNSYSYPPAPPGQTSLYGIQRALDGLGIDGYQGYQLATNLYNKYRVAGTPFADANAISNELLGGRAYSVSNPADQQALATSVNTAATANGVNVPAPPPNYYGGGGYYGGGSYYGGGYAPPPPPYGWYGDPTPWNPYD